MSYIGNEPIVSATRTITEVTATAGQTVFTANGGYTVGYIDVFLNGAQLQTVDFTATNGTTITLTEAAQVGDVIRLVAWGTFSTATHVPLTGDSNITGNINVSGNLGVGTTSPTQKLDVRGGSMVIDTASAGLNPTVFFDHDNFASGTRNYIQMSRTTEGMIFGVANADRMVIDASGRVTMPYQPAFHVIRGAGNFQTNGVVNFASPATDVGSNWNTSTHRFTAPVAGRYLFVFSALIFANGRTWSLRKNGSAYVNGYTAVNNWEQTSLSAVIYLSVNDYVDIYADMASQTGIHESTYTNFAGYLIG